MVNRSLQLKMIIISYLTTVVGVAMSLAYYFQAYNIIKNKSSENVSLVFYIIFSLGTVIWLIYGIYLMDWAIIFPFSVGVPGSWLVLILKLMYRKNKTDEVPILEFTVK